MPELERLGRNAEESHSLYLRRRAGERVDFSFDGWIFETKGVEIAIISGEAKLGFSDGDIGPAANARACVGS